VVPWLSADDQDDDDDDVIDLSLLADDDDIEAPVTSGSDPSSWDPIEIGTR
jgi:hypothetical protein